MRVFSALCQSRKIVRSTVAVTTVLGASLIGVGATSVAGSGAASSNNKITVAFPVGLSPNFIFPIIPPQDAELANLSYFTYLMFRPLYWYGTGPTTNLDASKSLAYPPVYNSTDTAVTIRLKNYKWSDGKPVSARDIEFWQNLITAGKSGWYSYNVGAYPDNIAKTTIVNPTTVTFTFDHAYNPTWFTNNELSQITPLPQQVMDVTSASSPVGDYDMTPSGASAVVNYLTAEGQKVNTFTSSPLWKTVDGPWKLKSLSQNGQTIFTRNTAFSGPTNKSITELVEEPFASPTAVTNAILSKNIDYTVITSNQFPLLPRYQGAGYDNATGNLYGLQGLIPNENNPTYGALFKQTYFRQVMERMVDQPTIVSKLLNGQASPACGPVPLKPASKFVSPLEKACPLSYNPKAVATTLKAHGWQVNPGGVSVCQTGGAGGCGEGVPTGLKAQFQVIYPQGDGLDQMMLLIKSDAAKVGLQYTIQAVPIGTVFGTVLPCAAGSSACNWQIGYYAFIYQPNYLPSGDFLFTTGAPSNVANYSDPTADALINNVFHDSSLSAFYKFEDYFVMQSPWIWLPWGSVHYEVNSSMHGAVPINVFLFIDPESWRFR
jgi:peptide/nickel transport system substrate-binding protein